MMNPIDLARFVDEIRDVLIRWNAEQSDMTLTIDGTEYAVLITETGERPGRILAVLRPRQSAWLCDAELRKRYGLTQRQIDVARLLADRRSDKEIAKQLHIRENTVGTHVQMVMIKLGVGRRKDVRDLLLKKPSAVSPA